MKRLYRDKTNEMLAGVCSGIAEYLDVDPTIIRLVFVLFAFLGGGGVWVYLVLWIIMPEKPITLPETAKIEEKSSAEEKVMAKKPAAAKKTASKAPAKKPAQSSAAKKPPAASKSKAKPKAEADTKKD